MIDFAARLSALRLQLAQHMLDGFLVPMADEYQSEYVPPSAQRIQFLSGFTGSAGLIVVLNDKAAFFTDSRYTLQASRQLPKDLFAIYDSAMKSPGEWLRENMRSGMRLGFDPWLHTARNIERLQKTLSSVQAELLPVEKNLVDLIWADRPAPPLAPIHPHDLAYAGKSSAEKREAIADALKKKALDAAIITDTASVAWLLNVRGGDVENTPLPLSFAIIDAEAGVEWFVDPRKITEGLQATLGTKVQCRQPRDFQYALEELGAKKKRVRIDPDESAHWIVQQLHESGATLDYGDDPCSLPKACKNPVELDGVRAAHSRDGAALSQFLAWFDWHAPTGLIDELAVCDKLASLRAPNNLYRGPSFDTIAGAGPNGAIVHYRADLMSNRKIEGGTFFLLDSGGQYLDGTTDVTRTISVGMIGDELRDRFTRVLKGHIALAAIRFPAGTSGAELDVLARQFLWERGLDYGHGTGHGVGSYLGVHEGPQGISRRNNVALQPGMIVSNEPGYYETNRYGIRIENLQVVIELPEISSATHKMLGFETLTLAPIDRRAILPNMLSAAEREWLNHYHTRVRTALAPQISDAAALDWLTKATAPI